MEHLGGLIDSIFFSFLFGTQLNVGYDWRALLINLFPFISSSIPEVPRVSSTSVNARS
jgi:hypothetical protein